MYKKVSNLVSTVSNSYPRFYATKKAILAFKIFGEKLKFFNGLCKQSILLVQLTSFRKKTF